MMPKILFSSATTKAEKILELQNRISQTEERIKQGQLSNDKDYVYTQLRKPSGNPRPFNDRDESVIC